MADFGGAPAVEANLGLLRVLACGSVDDGKSTLLGRLVFEAGGADDDALAAMRRDSARRGAAEPDYSLLLDGLEAEREQGITIDVAYRFFSTPNRAFIVADAPGHEQYTRNMATGASTADLAILLVDTRKGLLPQTRRHAVIASLLGVRQAVLAVNKMDLVGWDQTVFDRIVADFTAFAARLSFDSVQPIPVAAKSGGNIKAPAPEAPWYAGPTLLDHLERAPAPLARPDAPFRFPVQWVNRPNLDFRGVSGTVASGEVAVGDAVVVAESGAQSTVARIVTADGDLPRAVAGDAVTLTFADDIDAGRGDLIAPPKSRPEVSRVFSARLIWMEAEPLKAGDRFLLKIGGRTTPARITALTHGVSIDDLSPQSLSRLDLNGLADVEIETAEPVAFDPYAENRRTGGFILIDRTSRATAAAGLILHASGVREVHPQGLDVTRADRERLAGHKGACVWITGLSGSGKSTLANALEEQLHARGWRTMLLDGDNLRQGLNAGLGFSPADRAENLRRTGEVARLFVEAGVVVICALISPLRADREKIRERFAHGDFLEIFVDAPIDLCRARDAKGLYAKADRGEIKDFTGVSAPYEAPLAPEVRLDASAQDLRAQVAAVVARLDPESDPAAMI